MTAFSEDTGNDAIKKFKKRKYEDHKANRRANSYPEGFGRDDSSFERPAKRFQGGNEKFGMKSKPQFSGKFGMKSKPQFSDKFGMKSKPHFSDKYQNQEAETDKPEKTDWKKLKLDKAELKNKRQKEKKNDVYVLGAQTKTVWEELRQANCKGARREELCDKLLSLVKGKVKSLVFAHDTVRVIETLLAVGKEKHRSLVFHELKDSIIELSKNKYSRYFVLKMLRYSSKEEKNKVILAFKGHVADLMKHKMSSDVIELAYNDYANAKQRSMMVQEFYGPEFRLFHDEGIKCLKDALEKHPDKKTYILKDMWKYLQPIVEKGVFTNTMVHTLLRDFLTHCSKESRTSLIESLKENLAPIIHTRDGARVAMLCLWHGSNKDRKAILRSFRTHFVKIALEQHGYMVLLAAFDCVDDTEFMKKAVLNELMEDLPQLVSSDSGMKVLRYVIAPRDPMFFHPDIIKVLQEGDGNETSKKDTSLRQEELQKAVRLAILRLLNGNIEHWAVNANWTLLIGAALNVFSGAEATSIFEHVANLLAKEYFPDTEEDHVLDISHTMKMVSYFIKCDKRREEEQRTTFSSVLMRTAEPDTITSWINCNRGCFLLVTLIETEIEDIVLKLKRILKPHEEKLSTLKFKGAEILLTKL